MTVSTLRSTAWAQALGLRERGCAPGPPADRELAEHRLRRWQAQPPFAGSTLFAQRLAVDGLSESELLALLGESPRRLIARLSSEPAWATQLVGALESPFQGAGQPTADDERALLVVVSPLVERARARVTQGARTIAAEHSDAPFDPERVASMLEDKLDGRLFSMLARSMAAQLHTARVHGLLDGETSSERFWSFVEYLQDPEGAMDFFEAYPVLARQVTICLDQWVTSSLEFIERLSVDRQSIQTAFGAELDLGSLTRVDCGLGDPHQAGRSVMVGTFSSGRRVVYKPKPLSVDVHFQQLLGWLNTRSSMPALRQVVTLARSGYGWVEFVDRAECPSRAAVARFYQRLGSQLALLHMLAATDFHYENLIAAGEDPILIDLEALLHPSLRAASTPDAFQRALARMENSVLSVGLLPQPLRLGPAAPSLDVSGLGASVGQLSPRGVPRWEGGATDEARVSYQRIPLSAGQHRPTLDGEAVDVLDYADSILDGFTTTYRLLLAHRAELLADDGPLARFANDEVRLLLRPTAVYGRLLTESFHPDLLRDALERDRFLDRLWVAVPNQPRLVRAIAAEQVDLSRGDIPKFTTRPSSNAVWSASGERIEGVIEETGLALARRRVAGLSEAELAQQVWFVRAALGSLPGASEPVAGGHLTGDDEASPTQLLEAACAIGDRLEQLAIVGEDDATWIGLSSASGGLAVVPLGADLYEGLPGVALFLAYLGQQSHQERYTRLARQALLSLRRLLASGLPTLTTLGAFSGWGGVIYALAHLGALWDDATSIDEAVALAERLPDRIQIASDDYLDVASGAAGCIGALLALHQHAPRDALLALAVECGERLLATAKTMPRGIGWTTPGGEAALTGFAHGAAGIAWALLHLAEASGQDRFAAAAERALEYERSLYSPTARNWPDLRRQTTDGSAEYMVAWCHGAPGIGLARLASPEILKDVRMRTDVQAALETTLEHGSGSSHALCHGDLGNLDLFLVAGQVLGDRRWHATARGWAGSVLTSIGRDGWRCATPFGLESPGLMTGLAGIGYGLLRAADPERVPSVLGLAPPGGA